MNFIEKNQRSAPGFARPSVGQLIDAHVEWRGDADTFALAWSNYMDGSDFPCPDHPAGIHSTYLEDDGSCNYCGDRNRG